MFQYTIFKIVEMDLGRVLYKLRLTSDESASDRVGLRPNELENRPGFTFSRSGTAVLNFLVP